MSCWRLQCISLSFHPSLKRSVPCAFPAAQLPHPVLASVVTASNAVLPREMDEERDPIISRMNVFLSKRLSKDLLLLQYPVRSAGRTYDDVEIVSARMKPRQHCVELQVAVDVKGHSHRIVDDSQSNVMTLTSSPSGSDASRYAVGVLNNGELHLTPLTDVVHMRPSYSYLDNQTSSGARGATGTSGAGAGESSQDEAEDSRPVTVRFAPHESEDALARRMASYEHFKRQVDEEPWVNVRQCSINSYESHLGRLQLLCEKKHESTEFYLSSAKYLQRLIPPPDAEVLAVASLPSNILSLAALKAMARDERIKALMRSVRAICFSELLSVLRSLGNEQSSMSSLEFIQDVLKHLQHCAVLIQGCWVVKSEMLYAKDSTSEQTGASSNVLRSARDYILYRFHLETRPEDRVVTRRDVADNVAPLSMEDEREILDKIARRSSLKRGWEFRFARDTDFLAGDYYRFVGKTQEAYWQKQDAQWQKLQTAKKSTLTSPNRSPEKTKRSRSRKKSVNVDRSMSEQSESDADVSTKAEEHSSKVVDAGAESDDCTIVSASVNRRNASATAFKSIAQQDADNNEDVLRLLPLLVKAEPGVDVPDSAVVSQPSAEHVLPALTEFAAERLRSHSVLSVNSLKTQLDVYRASLPIGHVLGLTSGIASMQQLMDQALLGCGAVRASFSSERGASETVYMLRKRGDRNDVIRDCLVELLSSQKSLKLSTLRKQIEKMDSSLEYSDADLRSVLREYCFSAGGCWALKETSRTSADT